MGPNCAPCPVPRLLPRSCARLSFHASAPDTAFAIASPSLCPQVDLGQSQVAGRAGAVPQGCVADGFSVSHWPHD